MKFRILLIVFLCLAGFSSRAQTYFLTGGLRAGTELGLTVQQRLWETGTLEGILTTNRYRWQGQFLVEYHRRFIGRRINLYLGLGPHYGEEKGVGHYYGITPISGIEMTFGGINISWDYKPSINLGGDTDAIIFHDSGLSIRLVLIKQHKRSLKKRLNLD